MLFEVNKDLKKSYFSALFSPKLDQWLIKENEHNTKLLGSGSYGEVFFVELGDGFRKRAVAKKVTRIRNKSKKLSDEFVREFGTLELNSRAQTPFDRLIRCLV